MTIFGIIGIVAVISISLWFIVMIPVLTDIYYDDTTRLIHTIISSIVAGCLLIGGVFAGIGINDRSERIFVEKFKAQKYTIERSLENEDLSGLERIQLVTKAAELNGEFAERKVRYEIKTNVHYDYAIYDGVELIKL